MALRAAGSFNLETGKGHKLRLAFVPFRTLRPDLAKCLCQEILGRVIRRPPSPTTQTELRADLCPDLAFEPKNRSGDTAHMGKLHYQRYPDDNPSGAGLPDPAPRSFPLIPRSSRQASPPFLDRSRLPWPLPVLERLRSWLVPVRLRRRLAAVGECPL